MLPIKPQFLAQPFCQNGSRNTIPESSDADSGLANLNDGFPLITEQTLINGGLPPQRKDFNGILYLLSAFAFYLQSGGMFTWLNTTDYPVPAMVMYNNVLYICIKANGPGTSNGVVTPGTNTSYWQSLASYIADRIKSEKIPVGGCPVGSIIMWASSTNPASGVWLDCNGQSCTNYPDLVSVLGSNTVPNLSGLFPRCIGQQTVDNTAHTAPTLLNKQGDAIRNITGSFYLWKHTSVRGAFAIATNERWANSKNGGSDPIWRIDMDCSKVVPVATENRPANIGLRFLILASQS